MHNIANFAQGLVPNAAYTRARDVTARDWNNLRVTEEGFLTTRQGHSAVTDNLPTGVSVKQIFQYKDLMLAVVSTKKLMWARVEEGDTHIDFEDFDALRNIDITRPYKFQPIDNATGEYILVSNGSTVLADTRAPYVVDLTADTDPPDFYPMYLIKPDEADFISRQVRNIDELEPDDYHDPNHVEVYLQVVRTNEVQKISEDQEIDRDNPWKRDFTQDDPAVSLVPAIAVSEAVPAVGERVSEPFTISLSGDQRGDNSLPYNSGDIEDQIAVTGLTGDDIDTYLEIDTSSDPNALKTVADAPQSLYSIRGGTIDAELIRRGSRSTSNTATVRFQANTGDTTWIELGELASISVPSSAGSTAKSIELEYNDTTLGVLEADTVIKFRLAIIGNEDVGARVVDQSIDIEVESGFIIETATLESLENAGLLDDPEHQPHTELTFQMEQVDQGVPDDHNLYVDVYHSRRRDPPAPYRGGYYHVARLFYTEAPYPFTIKFPVSDDVLEHPWLDFLPTSGERIVWDNIEVDAVRIYATAQNDNNLYLSYFDGINERRFMNLTDSLALPLYDDEITAIKMLPETPWLAVYTASQIILVITDSNPELFQVVGRYGALDKDESIGCIAPGSLAAVGRYHYFLAGNKRVYRFSGRGPTWVSSSVQPILQSVVVPTPFEPVNAHAIAHDGHYYLSFQATEGNDIYLGEARPHRKVGVNDQDTQMGADKYVPNTTLVLDTERMIWYKDDYGAVSFVKTRSNRLYGVILGEICSLYDTDDDDLRWLWRSNRLLLPVQQLIHNINVKTQGEADIDVTVSTEEGEQTQSLSIEDANHYYGQRAGVNLRGRILDLTVQGAMPAVIDRITINERPRRVNLR